MTRHFFLPALALSLLLVGAPLTSRAGASDAPAPAAAASPVPAAPVPQRAYRIDPAASRVEARVPFLGIGHRTAQFPAVAGTARLSPQRMDRIAIDVRIDASQLTASDDLTTRRLKGDRFFDVANHPSVRFQGQSLTMASPTQGRIDGQLTARGVTRPASLAVQFAAPPLNSPPGARLTLSGTTTIDRRAYGMTAFSGIVGRQVTIKLTAALAPL